MYWHFTNSGYVTIALFSALKSRFTLKCSCFALYWSPEVILKLGVRESHQWSIMFNCIVHHYKIKQYIALGGFLIYIILINIYISGVPRNQTFNLLHVIGGLPKILQILHQIRWIEETTEGKRKKKKESSKTKMVNIKMAKLLCRHLGSVIDSLSPSPASQSRIWEKIPVVTTSLHKSNLQIIDNMKLLVKSQRIWPKF